MIELRYGLRRRGARSRSTSSASAFGVTRERIRQIEALAIERLRNSDSALALR